jgi:hypothetical protein
LLANEFGLGHERVYRYSVARGAELAIEDGADTFERDPVNDGSCSEISKKRLQEKAAVTNQVREFSNQSFSRQRAKI